MPLPIPAVASALTLLFNGPIEVGVRVEKLIGSLFARFARLEHEIEFKCTFSILL